jgi:predicted AAA+ superfamily ATPase
MPKIYFEDSGILNYLKYNDIVEKVSGELFENSVYSELRKAVGLEALRYWRTQSKQEIDFVIHHQRQLFTLEVKKIYSGQKTTSLEYFSQKYPNSRSFIITLEKRREAKENILLLYPWEIFSACPVKPCFSRVIAREL